MRRRILLIHNPLAGYGRQRRILEVGKALRAQGAMVDQRSLGDVATETALAIAISSADMVAIAGGDGTIRSLFARLTGTGLPLGIVPAGTGNVMAAEIAMPTSAATIAQVLLDGPVLPIQGATANGAPFFLMAGVGFDAGVITHLNHATKKRIGKAAYAAPLLAAWLAPQPPFEAVIDGRPETLTWLIAARARHYGGRFVLTEAADLRRPGLHAVMIRSKTRLERLGELATLATSRLDRIAGIEVRSCQTVVLPAGLRLPVQLDGDPFATTPLVITAEGPVVNLIVPSDYAATRPAERDVCAPVPIDAPSP